MRKPRRLETRKQRERREDAARWAEVYAEMNAEVGMPEGTSIFGGDQGMFSLDPTHGTIALPECDRRFAIPVDAFAALPPGEAGEATVLMYLDALREQGRVVVELAPPSAGTLMPGVPNE